MSTPKSASKVVRTSDVRMPDGSTSAVRLFDANSATSASPDKPLVVIWPGFGMGGRYYDPIASELAVRGYLTATGELRGQGSSTAVASRKKTWGYHDLASQDYPTTVRAAKKELGLAEDHPTLLLCHSMGGQIGSLFLARPEAEMLNVQGMFGVGAGSPHYKGFSGEARRRLVYGAPVMGIGSLLIGYWPGGKLDIAGYGPQARSHTWEWFRFGRTNALRNLHGQDRNYMDALAQVRSNVLLTRFTNDDDCPRESAQSLANLMPRANCSVEELEGDLGHNRWAREPHVVVEKMEAFVRELKNSVG